MYIAAATLSVPLFGWSGLVGLGPVAYSLYPQLETSDHTSGRRIIMLTYRNVSILHVVSLGKSRGQLWRYVLDVIWD